MKRLVTLGNGIALLTLLVVCVVTPWLPEKVPLHWNFRGEVDGTGSRWWMLLLGALPVLTALLFALVPRFDQRRPVNEKALQGVSLATTLFLSVVACLTLAAAFGLSVRMETTVPALIGFLFLAIAVMLPPVRWLLAAEGMVFFGIAWLPLPAETKWIGGLVLVFVLTIAMVVWSWLKAKQGRK